MLPTRIIYTRKCADKEVLQPKKIELRREFSLKDPNYSLNANIPESQIMHASSYRHNNNKFMFDSAHFRIGTQ